ncbi:SDR family NAD(P)-dependent oxidoreductase [Sphaerisporangium sp. TRM90804]|uniref:SDR family NAD(P)-dependent oxidoreductase n=1 Tax=Sphaerisporangium sp. TRM90804 TaxID=3031113 RepID=UPI00244C0848|nr:SDR family NAD(P)-dependent oxidoreductase [Sphaerisporangium sp. TRM90804]MDH2427188.1 SDR family NAD(P)-dependent oxidoreductase [Sphaerisporangium sp. TRM90804]
MSGIRLDGSNALVTGGTRGIGRSVVLGLARAGANVVTCYSGDTEAAARLERDLEETEGKHHVVRADVSDPAQIAGLAADCRARFGTLQIVVHNAGVISHVPFAKLARKEWDRVLDTNLSAAYHLTQETLPLLSDGSSVIFVGSKAALVGIPLRAHYTAAKAGLIGLARSLSKELGPRGIRVNVVAPGIIDTVEPDAAPDEGMDQRLEEYRRRSPLGRLGRPEDVANVVVFLSGDQAAYITGETVNVDGGL